MKNRFKINDIKLSVMAVGIYLLFSIAPISSSAAPVTFNTALPVSQKEIIWREQFVYKKSEDANGNSFGAATLMSVLGYGVTPDLAIFGVLPYTRRFLDASTGNSLGDARIFGRYTIYKHDFTGGTFRIAPFVGLEVPTGEDQESDAQGVLPTPLQKGSGAWDYFGGLISTYASIDYNLDAQISYQNNGEDHGIEGGDIFRADASFQYRIFPKEINGDVQGYTYALLESNFVYEDKMRVNGVDNANSGGTRLYLTPGLQYAAKRWIGEVAVQIPVTQNLNGTNREDGYIIRTGFRINF